MKKICFILLSLLFLNAFAIDEDLADVGIAKYAVLEVNSNNTPLRDKPNEDAKRISHLFEKSIVFADKQNKNYYRIELNDNDYAWINKKHVEVQAIIPEKRFDYIKHISFKETKNMYEINIEGETLGAYQTKENATSLDTTFYDMHFDPIGQEKIKNKNFKITNTIDTKLQINYLNDSIPFGYLVSKDDKGYLLQIKKTPKINPKRPLKHMRVTLDPGHGGVELGACCFDLKEKDINLQIAKKTKKALKKRGAKVFMTRTKDKKVDLYDRVSFAQENESDILISIHQNSLPNRKDIDKKYGTGTYYYYDEAKPLAQKIKENMILVTNFRDDGTNYASFVLTRATMPISVLVECGYIIRQEEAQKLTDKKFQKEIAKAITKGCEEYLIECFSGRR